MPPPSTTPPSFLPTLPRPRHSAAHHLGARYSYDIVSFLVYSPSHCYAGMTAATH